jgi:aerobic-type carbon monoxide dehydrogenase small subunit (CoxS/CutS family)
MKDFLREYLGMTGTKFGCGAAPIRNVRASVAIGG